MSRLGVTTSNSIQSIVQACSFQPIHCFDIATAKFVVTSFLLSLRCIYFCRHVTHHIPPITVVSVVLALPCSSAAIRQTAPLRRKLFAQTLRSTGIVRHFVPRQGALRPNCAATTLSLPLTGPCDILVASALDFSRRKEKEASSSPHSSPGPVESLFDRFAIFTTSKKRNQTNY